MSARPLQVKPKEPPRGRVRITRQTRGNISHVSHLGEYRTAYRQVMDVLRRDNIISSNIGELGKTVGAIK